MTDSYIRSLERTWVSTGVLSKELQQAWRRVGRCYDCGRSDCVDFCLTILAQVFKKAQSMGISVEEATINIVNVFKIVDINIEDLTKNISK